MPARYRPRQFPFVGSVLTRTGPRRRLCLLLVLSLVFGLTASNLRLLDISTAQAQTTAPPAAVNVEIPIAASSDDAGIGQQCNYSTFDNEIYFGECWSGLDITSGFRFADADIPQGATILEAHIRFTVDGPYTDDEMTVRFSGEASGDAQTFSDSSRPEDRPLIPGLYADWQITAADPWTLGESRDSPPLTAIIQAIVDRSDWNSGNALAIITQDVGTPTGTWRLRRVIGYDRPIWFPGTEYAARLVVTYSQQPSPPSPAPDWSAFGGQEGAWLGYSVATAGDVNGDGYSDVIVGAYLYDGSQTDAGRVFVYHGSASGLGATPAWTADGDQAGDGFGFSVATAGDVNGDGYTDIVVGACNCDNGRIDDGRAFVYLGSPSGLQHTPVWTAQSDQTDARFGASVATAGDVNGDGYSDIVVGAHEQDVGPGHAYLFLGGPGGPSNAPSWTGSNGQDGSRYGFVVATAGDVNGDGYADLAVGADRYSDGQIWEGAVYVYYGTATGPSVTASWTAQGDSREARMGYSVGTAGDVNGDGYAELIVGVPDNPVPFYRGRAQVYLGSASGLPATPEWVADGDQDQGSFGVRVSTAGDVDGDGYADIIVAAHTQSYGQTNEGRIYIYRGSPSGPVTASPWIAESNQVNAYLGWGLGTAGDVDGDGYADVIAGAYRYDASQADEGAAFAYHGGPDGLSATANWTNQGGQSGALFGLSANSAGDVNGDGYADVIVGAQKYSNGQAEEGRAVLYHGSASGLASTPQWMAEGDQEQAYFSTAVGSAGDVNGDGYGDVIISAPDYDSGEQDEGRVAVYLGSADGLAVTPAWIVEGNQVDASLGVAGSAGDVNGDGYGDVFVGAVHYDNGEVDEGRVAVYHGSSHGLSDIPAWTAEGNQAGAWFGASTAQAGDVNGDGFSDLIVGALYYDDTLEDQGRVSVYYGSAEGLQSLSGWTVVGEQPHLYLGYRVASAGDVNGDGYADVILGVPYFENGEIAEGQARVYLGSAEGLAAVPSWTVEGNQVEAYLGFAASTASDVNGDGFADVIVGVLRYDDGEIDEGRALVYAGSASGLSTAEVWAVESNQADSRFGCAVNATGDVNGDGYGDVIVGAFRYDVSAYDEGAAFVYYGNQGGLSLQPQQRRSDNTAPIAYLGQSDQPDAFRLALLGRTPFGRGKVKLEWEVKPRGVLFDGTALQRSAGWIDTGATGAQLDELVDGLQEDTSYHWRVRLLYHPATTPFQQSSRWITNPWNGWNEARLRTTRPPTAVRFATFGALVETSSPPPLWLVTAALALASAGGAATRRRHKGACR